MSFIMTRDDSEERLAARERFQMEGGAVHSVYR